MTQVSSNTLTYDQIFLKVKDFYAKNFNDELVTNEDKIQAYQSLLLDIQNSIAKPTSKYNPIIKGEPPTSSKFNSFIQSLNEDIVLISKQMDYLSAKIINSHNLFSNTIETEKKYLERIASKAKVLQMYSNAPAENLIYIGDVFDNADYVEIGLIPTGQSPHIENGNFSLPIGSVKPWTPRTISLNTIDSNGFMGNDHEVITSVDANNEQIYSFVYKTNPSISSTSAIADDNALTYFEYDGVNVDKLSNPNVDLNLVSENEFCYISNKKINGNIIEGDLVNWSNFDMTKPLKLVTKIEAASEYLANTLTIIPYFGSCQMVKVTAVKAVKNNGEMIDLIDQPIYIGSAFAPINNRIANQYYYDKAILKFSEIRVLRFEVHFEQEDYREIDVMHAYWKPSFPANPSDADIANPFFGMSRFNPDSLSSDVYEKIQYDKYALVPSITLPNQFKNIDRASKIVNVTLKKKPTVRSGYTITIKRFRVDKPEIKKDRYFYNWTEEENVQSTAIIEDMFDGIAKLFASESEALIDLQKVKDFYDYYISNPTEGEYIDGLLLGVEDVVIEYKNITVREREKIYPIKIDLKYETYKAKRKAIGIRDISASYEQYANSATVISKLYYFDSQIESLMLDVDYKMDKNYIDDVNINYFVSLNQSNWIQLSPIQNPTSGVAEVLVFNKNISNDFKIAGIGYLNYPQIPRNINNIRVKIEVSKNRSTNVTPLISSYKLIAGIVQQ